MVSHTENVWEGAGLETTWAGGYGTGTRLLPNPPRLAANLSKVPYLAEDGEMPYVSNDVTFIKPAGAKKDTVVPFVKGLNYGTFKRKQYFMPTNSGCMGLTFIQDASESTADTFYDAGHYPAGLKGGMTPISYFWHWDSPDVGEFDARGCILTDYLLEVKPDEFPFESLEFLYYDVTTSYYQSTNVDYDTNQPITWDDFSITVDSLAVEFLSMSYHVKRNVNDERVGGRFQRAQPYVISVDTDVKLKFRTDSASLLGDFKPVPGYQEFGLSGKVGTDATGLDVSTQYYYKINAVEYTITTGLDVTFTAVIALLNTAAASPGAQWSLVGGDLRCTSAISTGSIAITDGSTGGAAAHLLAKMGVTCDPAVAASQAIDVQPIVITIAATSPSNTITMTNMTVDPEDITINKLPGEMSLFEYDVTLKKGGASTIVWA